MGTNQLSSLKSLGFEGEIYPISPKEGQVQDPAAYKSVLHLPEVPDLAVKLLPMPDVPQVLEECEQEGIKNSIEVSGAFKETRQGITLCAFWASIVWG